jgi:hypothetical protein
LFDTTVTTGNNKPYRCNGTTWEIVNDLAISDSQIVANTITAGSIFGGTITGNEVSASTTLTAGTGNNVAKMSGSDANYRIWAGHATPASAPFSVKKDGTVTLQSSTSTTTSRLVIDDDQIMVFEGATLKVLIGRLS